MTKDEDIKLTMLCFFFNFADVIEDMRLEIYSSNDFNFYKYIKNCTKNY